MKKIHETITRETWLQGVGLATDTPWPNNELATCALGHLVRTYGNVSPQIKWFAMRIGGSISAWNDAPERTFEEVLAAFKAVDL